MGDNREAPTRLYPSDRRKRQQRFVSLLCTMVDEVKPSKKFIRRGKKAFARIVILFVM